VRCKSINRIFSFGRLILIREQKCTSALNTVRTIFRFGLCDNARLTGLGAHLLQIQIYCYKLMTLRTPHGIKRQMLFLSVSCTLVYLTLYTMESWENRNFDVARRLYIPVICLEKVTKTSVRMPGAPAEIQTEYILNTILRVLSLRQPVRRHRIQLDSWYNV
jgi:hypothetical protein